MTLVAEDLAQLQEAYSRIQVLPGMSAWEYLELVRDRYPDLYRRLNPARVPVERVAKLYEGIAELSTHFESKMEKGRGDSYRQAQNTSFMVRAAGFLNVFDLAFDDPEKAGPHLTVLDSLGGNGTLTRIVRTARPASQVPYIITSDVSGRMIESALGQGIPAVRQPLQDLIWFDDATFDSVLVAYGTHHVPPPERHGAVSEAARVLKPGGRVVLQDFEIGKPTTLWYEDVLDRWTTTGHVYEYFTRQDFADLLTGNGFEDVEVLDVYDPFILYAGSAEEARRQLLDYLFTLFALEKLLPEGGEKDAAFFDRMEEVVRATATFDPAAMPAAAHGVHELTVRREGDRWRAEVPRVCLCATGRKPA